MPINKAKYPPMPQRAVADNTRSVRKHTPTRAEKMDTMYRFAENIPSVPDLSGERSRDMRIMREQDEIDRRNLRDLALPELSTRRRPKNK